MKLGFIGTGHITKSVVEGIIGSSLKYSKIYLSKRNKKISTTLKKKNKKIIVIDNNQEIIDKSNWLYEYGTLLSAIKNIRRTHNFSNASNINKQNVINFNFPLRNFNISGKSK